MLIPIQYHKKNYPSHIRPYIDEIAGHFDIECINPKRAFSLHTEYSYGKRQLNSMLIAGLKEIQEANRNGIPMLWRSKRWAKEFAEFIKKLVGKHQPAIIEIHPPFNDYVESHSKFLEIYSSFEQSILSEWNDIHILIENRNGTMYRGGRFLLSKAIEVVELVNEIDKSKLNLCITLDFPQLFSAYGGPTNMSNEALKNTIETLLPIRHRIKGIHLWGKKRNSAGRLIAHCGDLTSYFEDHQKKETFLDSLNNFLNDKQKRFLVPEVNSKSEHLHSIIDDLENAGIQLITNG